MDLIQSIRRGHGLDIEVSEPHARAAIEGLQQNLKNALHNLSESLYSKSTHFLFELIQNADDNLYPEGAIPALHITLSGQSMIVECNEDGFNQKNVRAICSVGNSTKKGQSGYIGEKGIGFKSVFTVSEVVEVLSKEYAFKFDKSAQLGMIAPIWTGTPLPKHGWTSFHLTLSPTTDAQVLTPCLDDIQPTLLLFLRRLRCIQLHFRGQDRIFRLCESADGLVHLEASGDISKGYLIVKHQAVTCPSEEKRSGIVRSEVVLAFPMDASGSASIKDQAVYAFLPLRSFGLSFIVQADFLAASSREDILTGRPWNIALRNAIAPAFLKAVDQFHQRPNLEFDWLQYVPINVYHGFMQPVQSSIIDALKKMAIFLCQDGQRRVGSSVIIPLAAYMDSKDKPLLPQYCMGPRFYLSPRYDTHRDRTILKTLGVLDMSPTEFVEGLQRMDHAGYLRQQNTDWYNRICSELQPLLGWPHNLRSQISRLRIIPLVGEILWRSSSADNIFFNSQLGGIPQGLEIHLVGSQISSASSHYSLLRELGIKEANTANIALRLLELHSTSWLNDTHHPFLPSHARFLFQYERHLSIPQQFCFWVLTKSGDVCRATDVYMNHRNRHSPSLEQRLGSTNAQFLHRDYFDFPEDDLWQDFLRMRLKLNVSPRLSNDALSPEFHEFLRSNDTTTILDFLKQYWDDIRPQLNGSSSSLEQLRGVEVHTSDGVSRRLDACSIGRRNLIQCFPDLPLLPLKDPENSCWDFLAALGVTFHISSLLYLDKLIRLSEKFATDVLLEEEEEEVYECYRQFEARFNDGGGERICAKFKERSLVYVPSSVTLPENAPNATGRWLPFASIVWSGPSSMRSKFSLDRTGVYPNFKKLFCEQLKVLDCPEDILLQEMKLLASECGDGPLLPDQVRQAHHILFDIIAIISDDSDPGSWLSSFRHVPAFPVQTVEGIKLAKFTDDFYVPDRSGKLAQLFQNNVPILTLPSTQLKGSLTYLLLLFQSKWFKNVKYLETSVTQTVNTPVGKRILDVSCSEEYRWRVSYINRFLLAGASTETASQIHSFISKLKDMKVYLVDSINVTFSLGDTTHVSEDDLAIEVVADRFIVLLRKTCLRSHRDILLARELTRYLPGCEADSITILLNFGPPSALDSWLREKGVPPEPRDANSGSTFDATRLTETRDTRSLQTSGQSTDIGKLVTHTEDSISPSADVKHDITGLPDECAGIVKEAPRQSISPAAIYDLGQLQAVFRNLTIERAQSFENSYQGNASRSTVTTHSENMVAVAVVEGEGLPALMDVRSLNGPQLNVGRDPSDEQTHNIGILGEIYVYYLLSTNLPGFDANNWTSNLRRHVRGFEPFNGSSLADFTYSDRFGVLTSILFGQECKDSWMNEWPTYHLEVKTTSGPFQVPFHINKHQMATAASMSIRDSTIPRDIYVLLRVYSIRSGPSLKMYPDPYRALHDGHLQIVSDVEMAITT